MKTQKSNSTIKSILFALFTIALLSMGACNGQSNPNEPKMDIHTAALMGNLEAIKQHIAAKTNLNAQEMTAGSTPLITAALFGKKEVVKVLIEAGADINYQNREGSTALHTAAFFCHADIVELLLAKGADKTLVNKYNATALQSVSGSFNDVKGAYEGFGKALAPIGLKLDLDEIKAKRPQIAKLLQ